MIILLGPGLERTFYGERRPISEKFVPEALAVSGFSREQTLTFPEPEEAMRRFATWVAEEGAGRPMFVSDNNGFDWQFITQGYLDSVAVPHFMVGWSFR